MAKFSTKPWVSMLHSLPLKEAPQQPQHGLPTFKTSVVHDIEAMLVAELVPPWMMRVVRVAHGIEVALLPARQDFKEMPPPEHSFRMSMSISSCIAAFAPS